MPPPESRYDSSPDRTISLPPPSFSVPPELKGTAEMPRNVKFHLPSGSIGIEAIFSRLFVAQLDLMRDFDIRPTAVFTGRPANAALNRLIKRKFDELSIPWRDYSSNVAARKWFNWKLRYKGHLFLDHVGWPRYYDKNKRYIESIAVASHAEYAQAIFDTMDYEAFIDAQCLRFSEEESQTCRAQMQAMGVDRDHVCIHPRDDKFHGTFEPQRNVPVTAFSGAASYLDSLDIKVVKMGIRQDDANSQVPPNVIDYARHFRTELLDIWLIAHAKFYLGSNSGLFYVANWFNTPVAIVNYPGIAESTPLRAQDTYLPQKIWSKELRRMLTFREIAGGDIGLAHWGASRYRQASLEPVTSTMDEVNDLAIEMNQRAEGTFEVTAEDMELQARFRRLFKPSHAPYFSPCSVGRNFLRDNLPLLD